MIKMYNVTSRKSLDLGLSVLVSRPIFQRSRSREILVGLGLETKCLGLEAQGLVYIPAYGNGY